MPAPEDWMAAIREITTPYLVRSKALAFDLPESRFGWPLGVLLALCLGLLPVYLFPSGGLQVVDGPLVILILVHFLRRSNAPQALRQKITILLPFLFWAAAVNLVYFFQDVTNPALTINTGYLLFTFLLFLSFSYLFWDILEADRLGWLYAGFFLSLIGIFTVKGYSEEGIRSVLSFNNPNQLGYYALVLACLAALLLQVKEQAGTGRAIYFWADVVLLFAAHFLALLSLSRGALLGLLLVDIWVFPRLTRRILILFVPAVLLALVVLIWQPAVIEQRLAGRPGRELNKEEIQYEVKSRIFHQFSVMKDIHYLVGRGARGFTPKEKARGIGEVHNIFGEIFRSYGLIGLGLFSFWLGRFIWQSRQLPGGLFIWGALLVYNLTHYGLRFRSLWILLALINAMLVLTGMAEKVKGPNGRQRPPGLAVSRR
jgi:hypothetical protein